MSPKSFLFCLLPVFSFNLPGESAACKGNMALQDPGLPGKYCVTRQRMPRQPGTWDNWNMLWTQFQTCLLLKILLYFHLRDKQLLKAFL